MKTIMAALLVLVGSGSIQAQAPQVDSASITDLNDAGKSVESIIRQAKSQASRSQKDARRSSAAEIAVVHITGTPSRAAPAYTPPQGPGEFVFRLYVRDGGRGQIPAAFSGTIVQQDGREFGKDYTARVILGPRLMVDGAPRLFTRRAAQALAKLLGYPDVSYVVLADATSWNPFAADVVDVGSDGLILVPRSQVSTVVQEGVGISVYHPELSNWQY